MLQLEIPAVVAGAWRFEVSEPRHWAGEEDAKQSYVRKGEEANFLQVRAPHLLSRTRTNSNYDLPTRLRPC